MRVRLLIGLAVVGFAAPWLMVANQMREAAPIHKAAPMQETASLVAPATNAVPIEAQNPE